MMLEDKLVIVQILAYDFRVLIQNGKQRNHEDYALLFMFGGCRQSIAKGGQRFPSPGGDIQPVNARAPLGRRFAAVGKGFSKLPAASDNSSETTFGTLFTLEGDMVPDNV